jgi:hypothetical protein
VRDDTDGYGRLVDRPSKHYICDALDALVGFVKVQRKKAHAKERRRGATAHSNLEDDDEMPALEPITPAAGVPGPAPAQDFDDDMPALEPVSDDSDVPTLEPVPLTFGGLDDVD